MAQPPVNMLDLDKRLTALETNVRSMRNLIPPHSMIGGLLTPLIAIALGKSGHAEKAAVCRAILDYCAQNQFQLSDEDRAALEERANAG